MGKKWKKYLESGFTKYLRELSVVMIGVFVTLWVTGMIADNAKEKEVDRVMRLIQTELEENLGNIEQSQQKWMAEQRVYQLILQHIDRIEEIPADTLEAYRKVIGDKHSMGLRDDSYEVFKSSLLTQYIKDKGFLSELSGVYGSIKLINAKLLQYTDMKGSGLNHTVGNIDKKGLDKWLNGDVYSYYKTPLDDNVFRSFVYNGGTLISVDEFETCKQEIKVVVDRIGKEKY